MRKISFSVSAKILTIFVSATLLVFLYTALFVVMSVKNSTFISEKEKASILLDSVASEIGMNMYLGLDKEVAKRSKELLGYKDVLSVTIFSSDGAIVSHFGSANATEDALVDAIKVQKEIRDSVTGQITAKIEISYSNRNYLRIINNFEQMLIGFFIVSTIIFGVALFFVKRLLSPLSDIASKMRGYIPGQNIEFERKMSSDEIGSIVDSFKAMQANIDSFLEEIRVKDSELMRQSKLKALTDMINAVAHNWRQPLNAIGIMLQDLEFAYEYGELNREYIKQSVESGMALLNKMSKTIDDFRLFFSSGESEEDVDMLSLVNEVVAAFEEGLLASGVKIFVDGETFTVRGQKELLREVLGSIILNSKDALLERALKEDGFKAQIVIKLDATRKTLECLDNGGGMSEEVIARAFEPYFTTKEQGKGVGLGLFMAKTVVRNMNGELTLANKRDGLSVMISF